MSRILGILSILAIVGALVINWQVVLGAEPQINRTELELTLRATIAEKEKYVARLQWGNTMSEEASRALPDLIQREQALTNAIRQLDEKEKAKASKPVAKEEK